jgi:hypothetical protein
MVLDQLWHLVRYLPKVQCGRKYDIFEQILCFVLSVLAASDLVLTF